MRTASEQFGAIDGRDCFFTLGFEKVELRAVGGEVGAKGLDALDGLFGLGGVELVFGEVGVLVDSAREGGQGGRYLALEGWWSGCWGGGEGI